MAKLLQFECFKKKSYREKIMFRHENPNTEDSLEFGKVVNAKC